MDEHKLQGWPGGLKRLLVGSPLRKDLAGGFAWSLAAKASATGLGLVLNIVLARLLLPEQVGTFFLASSMVTLIGTVSLIGLPDAAVKLVADGMALGKYVAAKGTSIRLSILGAAGVSLGGLVLLFGGNRWFSGLFHSPELGSLAWLVAIWMVVASLQRLLANNLLGLKDIPWAVMLGGQGPLTRVIVVLALVAVWGVLGTASLRLVFEIAVLASFLTLCWSGWVLVRRWANTTITESQEARMAHSDLRTILAVSWPFWVNSLSMLVFTQGDVLVLGALRPQAEVALYGIAARSATLITMPLLILNAILPPFVAELYARGATTRLEGMLRQLTTVTAIPAALIFGTLLVLGKPYLSLFFGAYYQQAYVPMVILAGGQLANALSGSCGILMKMSGHQTQFMKIALASTAVGAVLLFSLTRSVGMVGAAWAMAATTLGLMAWAMLYSWRIIGIRTWPTLRLSPRETR